MRQPAEMLAELHARLADAEENANSSHQRVRWLEMLTGIVAYEVWRAAQPPHVFEDGLPA